MKIKYTLITLFVLIKFVAFGQTSNPLVISNQEKNAQCTYLTKDYNANPVLSWIEGEKEQAQLYYSISMNQGRSFEQPIKVTSSKGLSAHHESMAKVAFKKNGDVVVVFQKRMPTPQNKYAGAIYYSQSFDKGLTWTAPDFLHSDTTSGIGRSFYDITTLPDGEIGAVWLDGRKKSRDGSTLMFAKTKGKKGFGKDLEIAQQTCQCCRTNIFIDAQKNINVTFRDVIEGKYRDMSLVVSKDIGKTFSQPLCISPDQWAINGCPHTGPTVSQSGNDLHFFWFTKGNGEGVFHTSTSNKKDFSKRDLVSINAQHPQATSLTNEKIILVWDEIVKMEDLYVSRIKMVQYNKNETPKSSFLTDENTESNYPVIISLPNGKSLVAWTQYIKSKTQVVYKIITLN